MFTKMQKKLSLAAPYTPADYILITSISLKCKPNLTSYGTHSSTK